MKTPLVTATRDPRWLSNSWLVADRVGGHAVLIDTGGPTAGIEAAIAEWRVEVTHVLCTHHHHDHVAHNEYYRARLGCPCCAHADESARMTGIDHQLAPDEELRVGSLRVRALHVPGHTTGQLAFLVEAGGGAAQIFTGDTLFRGSVGGTRAPGHGNFDQLQHSILDVLLALPSATVVRPGHMEPTTVGRELDTNPFVRLWRGLDAPATERCIALDEPATLLLRAPDYDGGTKCFVRFDDGRFDVVPGSAVVPLA